MAPRELRGETLRFLPRAVAPRYYDGVLAALRTSGETLDVRENCLPTLRNPASALSGRDFMILPSPLREHLPESMVGVPRLDDLPTVDLEPAWPRDAPAAVAALVDTARLLVRKEGWLPARRAGRARTYKTEPEPAP